MSFLSEVLDSVKDMADEIGDAGRDFIGGVVGGLGGSLRMPLSQIAHFVGDIIRNAVGQEAQRNDIGKFIVLIADIVEIAVNSVPIAVEQIGDALRSGKLAELVDIITPIATAAYETTEKQIWSQGQSVPRVVLDRLKDPSEIAFVSDKVRWTTIDRLDQKGFAWTWMVFSQHVAAITLNQMILFNKEPNLNTEDGIALFVHEIKHTLQTRDLGSKEFVRSYIEQKALAATFNFGVIPFEFEADCYACRLVPKGRPGYLPSCSECIP